MLSTKKKRKGTGKTRFNLGPRYVLIPLRISIFISLFLIIYTSTLQLYIQPVVPLFYSLPSGSDQLAPKIWLLLFPALSIIINIVHISAIKIAAMSQLVIKLYAWADLLLQLILLMIALRNTLIVL
ncbi:MAG: transmembrane(s)proteins 12..34 [Microgenomates bacterium 39_7]|nr:MAG: transmembrane(s)proteins 12..34 [Microgenomates bacterium 39_7]